MGEAGSCTRNIFHALSPRQSSQNYQSKGYTSMLKDQLIWRTSDSLISGTMKSAMQLPYLGRKSLSSTVVWSHLHRGWALIGRQDTCWKPSSTKKSSIIHNRILRKAITCGTGTRRLDTERKPSCSEIWTGAFRVNQMSHWWNGMPTTQKDWIVRSFPNGTLKAAMKSLWGWGEYRHYLFFRNKTWSFVGLLQTQGVVQQEQFVLHWLHFGWELHGDNLQHWHPIHNCSWSGEGSQLGYPHARLASSLHDWIGHVRVYCFKKKWGLNIVFVLQGWKCDCWFLPALGFLCTGWRFLHWQSDVQILPWWRHSTGWSRVHGSVEAGFYSANS